MLSSHQGYNVCKQTGLEDSASINKTCALRTTTHPTSVVGFSRIQELQSQSFVEVSFCKCFSSLKAGQGDMLRTVKVVTLTVII